MPHYATTFIKPINIAKKFVVNLGILSVRDGQTTHSLKISSQVDRGGLIREENKIILLEEENETVAPKPAQNTEIFTFIDDNIDKSTSIESQSGSLLISLDDLECNELLWFDKRVDYMGYIALSQAQELTSLPRLSSTHHLQIIGLTQDGQFVPAEPIPGLLYQAFVIGLQAIHRESGLASKAQLEQFAQHIYQLADELGGQARVADIASFLQDAVPFNQFCAQIYEVISIFLVPMGVSTISGTELKNHLENSNFVLSKNGVFEFYNKSGGAQYTIQSTDGVPFTEALLAHQSYKSIVMQFDPIMTPYEKDNFDNFIRMAIHIAGLLNLDLVDNHSNRASKEWLQKVKKYVMNRQIEMQENGIEPAGYLARRLFS